MITIRPATLKDAAIITPYTLSSASARSTPTRASARGYFKPARRGRERGLHRLELTVMTHNQLGLALHQKLGFQLEGTAQHALRVDGEYVDLHYMSKLL